MHDMITHDKMVHFFYPDLCGEYQEIVIYGAGNRGRKFMALMEERGVKTRAFIDADSKKHGTRVNGVTVFAPGDEALSSMNLPIVVCCYQQSVYYDLVNRYENVYVDFREHEFIYDVDHLANFNRIVEHDAQLFADEYSRNSYLGLALRSYDSTIEYRVRPPFRCYDHPVVRAMENDVIFDVGPYNGLFASHFIHQTSGSCHIHAFEPNHLNLALFLERIKKEGFLDNVTTHWAGVWTESGIRYLDNPAKTAVASVMEDGGEYPVRTWSLDDYAASIGIDPDFIVLERAGLGEMVIESSRDILLRRKPRLMFPM